MAPDDMSNRSIISLQPAIGDQSPGKIQRGTTTESEFGISRWYACRTSLLQANFHNR